ncbi:MAG TPA: type II toxin-antitoxin system RelE/ParE family toxin [Xanthobacteraceae bacterium]|nr:type II toxin-antitoxin system RelE/ParE family toxin [Xanthobacteraceae bacterium]
MNVRYLARAIQELEAISAYLRARNPAAADALIQAIEKRIASLADFPWIGPETDEPGTHELSISRFPYKIYYRIEGDDVWIVHIRHTSRRPWRGGDD